MGPLATKLSGLFLFAADRPSLLDGTVGLLDLGPGCDGPSFTNATVSSFRSPIHLSSSVHTYRPLLSFPRNETTVLVAPTGSLHTRLQTLRSAAVSF